jgi:NADH-ubiquinone oxidoreductase chain 5
MFDEQDMRRMGNLNKVLPFTYTCFLIGSLAITGFPFLTGFYSKDLILEFAYTRFIVDATFIYSLGPISAIFTAIYSIRLIIFVFFSEHSTGTFFKYAKYFENNTAECE